MPYAIKIEGLDKLRSAFVKSPAVVAGELEKGVKEAGKEILMVEKTEAPIKSGNLRRNIGMSYRPISVTVEPKSAYAVFVHGGTGLFGPRKAYIVPKRAKVLAWKSGGKMIFAKRVKGMQANPFVQRTVEKVSYTIQSIFNNTLSNITKKI